MKFALTCHPSALIDVLKNTTKLGRWAKNASRVLKVVAVIGVIADAFILAMAVRCSASQPSISPQSFVTSFSRRGSSAMNFEPQSMNSTSVAWFPRYGANFNIRRGVTNESSTVLFFDVRYFEGQSSCSFLRSFTHTPLAVQRHPLPDVHQLLGHVPRSHWCAARNAWHGMCAGISPKNSSCWIFY